MRTLKIFLIKKFLSAKYFLLKRYYAGLAVQARFLYRQSKLYKLRWQEVSYDFSEEMWEQSGLMFFEKAKKEPLIIRVKIFYDTMILRKNTDEINPYYQ